jgi:hypothetical protein
MSPKIPTEMWFDTVDTNQRAVLPDGSLTSYTLTVGEYARSLRATQRAREIIQNQRQIQILRREEFRNTLLQQIEAFGPQRPPRNQGESLIEYLDRLQGGV